MWKAAGWKAGDPRISGWQKFKLGEKLNPLNWLPSGSKEITKEVIEAKAKELGVSNDVAYTILKGAKKSGMSGMDYAMLAGIPTAMGAAYQNASRR